VDVPDYYFLNFYPFFCVDLPARFILQKYRKWKYQTILNKTPGLIFHCEFVKSQIEHPNKNIVHIGIEASRFERNPRPPRTNTILFVGSDYFRKGLPTVFKVFRSILKEHPEFELKIVGKERRHALIAAKIMSRKLPVSYYSGLSHEELVNLYLSAKVFVLPSRLEASSVALLEAMAAGIPIVSTYVGGIPEFIVHGQNGFLAASADDYKSLVKYINICLDDGAVVRRLVRNGKRVVAQFTIPRMVEQLEQSYQSVLNT
jgi:glycosyltransferase involved in cell wall biosynthesis